MRIVFLFLAAVALFAHNETETLEDHFVFETKVLHFVGSKVKKQALKSHLLYGKRKGAHNFIIDLKKAYVTTKLPKNLNVEKVGVQYRYAQEGWGVMAGILHVNDRLNEAADDVQVLTLGAHYKNWHLHLHRTTYSTFWIDQEEVQYFTRLFGAKTVLFGAVQNLHGYEKIAFSKNAQKHYVSGGAIMHAQKAALHWGAGALLGKNAFRVVQKGLDIRHHAFEFRYNLFVSVGKRFKQGIAHLKFYHAKATELPFHNYGVKLYGIGFDFSKRF